MEILAFDAWLVGLLTGDATMGGYVGDRVFEGFAPDQDTDGAVVAYPLVVFQALRARDHLKLGGRVAHSKIEFCCKVGGDGEGYDDLALPAMRMNYLLENAPNATVSVEGESYTMFGCHRLYPVQGTDDFKGRVYPYLGAVYRAYIEKN